MVPALRLDRVPVLLRAGGLSVLVLEVTLLPLVLWRVTRPFAVAAALGFHAATRVFFLIGFSSLWACYVVFVPWKKWLALESRPTQPAARTAWPAAVMAALVLGGIALGGALGVEHGWPFACYPTFRHDPGTHAPVLVAEEELAGGERRELPLEFLRGDSGQKEWGAMWELLARPEGPRLVAWWRAHRSGGGEVVRVRFYRAGLAADPDARGAPRRGAQLAEAVP
jgi:hypothetical protein